MPRHDIKTETITVRLNGVTSIKNAYLEKIDDANANAKQAWISMGKPESLTPQMVEKLEWKSSLMKEAAEVQNNDSSVTITLTLLPQATACITLELND